MIEDRLKEEKVLYINCDIYNQDVLFMYGGDRKKLLQEALEQTKPEYHTNLKKMMKSMKKVEPFTGVFVSKFPIRLIYITPKETLSKFIGVLTHEAIHCGIDILRYIKLPLDRSSEEAYTYLIEHIVECVCYSMFDKPVVAVPVEQEEIGVIEEIAEFKV